MAPPVEQVTPQGYDLQFGTNVLGALSHNCQGTTQPNFFLGHFYFTKLLIPALLAGAGSSPDGKARIVNTSSSASLFVGGVDFNTLKDTPARKKRTPEMLYSQSKLVCAFAYSQTIPVKLRLLREMCCFRMNWHEDTGTKV
jgi:NAD(P)-dependent dehydrogenase (short-subunit alcohol dehydrogenase family)